MIELPKTFNELSRLYAKLKTQGKLDNYGRALELSYAAYNLGERSLNNTLILLAGPTGAGKSSTINHLFGRDVCTVSDQESETRLTVEWKSKFDSTSDQVRNMSISIIDTPGFFDTSGPDQDACNLASIQKFFQKLSSKAARKILPNVVILAVKADWNRFSGPKSQLAKTCR
jgi:predicted GTPase